MKLKNGPKGCLLAFFLVFSLSSCQDKKLTVACVGDSLIRPTPLYLRPLLASSHIRIREYAQGGLSTATYLQFFHRHPRWRKERVDFILVQLGTNDVSLLLKKEEDGAAFHRNLEALILELKKLPGNFFRHPQLIIATAPPFYGLSDADERNHLIETIVNPTIKALAARHHLKLLDAAAIFHRHPELYEPDGVHPNREGEKALARHWKRAIRDCWRQARQGIWAQPASD